MASNEKEIIVNLIGKDKVVLDCGCGGGEIAKLLSAMGCRVIGIDIDEVKACLAQQWCCEVIVGDLEDEMTMERIRKLGYTIDCVLCSHILEHLRNPLNLLRTLKVICNPNFFVIALPNVAYWRVRFHLLAGRWEYSDEGILDRTHLRFFTLYTAIKLIEDAGLEVLEIVIPDFPIKGFRRLVKEIIKRITSPNFYSPSFVFKCR
jgi:methionine biosynthesis protein MetW